MYTGNNIVTNGLTLLIDAGNPKSYVGEPTTNLANNEATRSLLAHADTTASFASASEVGPDWKKATITTRGSNPRMLRFPYITQNSGSVRTYSVEYSISSSAGYYWKIDGQGGVYTGPVISGSGKFIYTISVDTTGPYSIFLGNNSGFTTGLNDVIYYRYYQVEDKDHSTPFTPTSRDDTWFDMSINNIPVNTVNSGTSSFSNLE